MKIAVCVKQVPDTETKIKLSGDQNQIDATGIKWVMNPYDENAVEESLKIRDQNAGSQVFVFTAGPKSRAQEVLRTALAMGADEGVVVDLPDASDISVVAAALASALKKEGPFDLVLTGRLAIDDNSSAVPQMVAELISAAHTTSVSKLSISSGVATAEREVEGGQREVLELSLPALVAANKGLNTPRYASLPGIMKAKKKTLKEYDLSALGISADRSRTRYSQFQLPAEKPPVKMLSGDPSAQAKQLTQLLRQEAKVL